MSEVDTPNIGLVKVSPRFSEWRRFRRVLFSRPLVVFGVIVLLVFIITAIFAPLIAPYAPNEYDLDKVLLQPSREHLLGTDRLGRDVLSRIVFGTRTSMTIGLSVVSIAALIGMTIGLIAGYYGRWVFAIIMRFTDAVMSFPMIVLALVIASLLGGGIRNVIIALTVSLIPVYTRLMCSQVLSVKENDYVLAARTIGAHNKRIMINHILINCFPPLIVLMTMMMGVTILAEAGLSFLGIGIVPPTPTWGAMVSDGYVFLISNPLLSIAPGLAIMLVVFAFNMVGDGLRDALDPRLRGTV